MCIFWTWISHDIIQIGTYDEHNPQFYGSWATILTSASPRSILLPKIKNDIIQPHRSIFAYYMSNIFGSSPLVYGYYTARFSFKLIIFYYYSMFYSLGHGATILTHIVLINYCKVRYHGNISDISVKICNLSIFHAWYLRKFQFYT